MAMEKVRIKPSDVLQAATWVFQKGNRWFLLPLFCLLMILGYFLYVRDLAGPGKLPTVLDLVRTTGPLFALLILLLFSLPTALAFYIASNPTRTPETAGRPQPFFHPNTVGRASKLRWHALLLMVVCPAVVAWWLSRVPPPPPTKTHILILKPECEIAEPSARRAAQREFQAWVEAGLRETLAGTSEEFHTVWAEREIERGERVGNTPCEQAAQYAVPHHAEMVIWGRVDLSGRRTSVTVLPVERDGKGVGGDVPAVPSDLREGLVFANLGNAGCQERAFAMIAQFVAAFGAIRDRDYCRAVSCFRDAIDQTSQESRLHRYTPRFRRYIGECFLREAWKPSTKDWDTPYQKAASEIEQAIRECDNSRKPGSAALSQISNWQTDNRIRLGACYYFWGQMTEDKGKRLTRYDTAVKHLEEARRAATGDLVARADARWVEVKCAIARDVGGKKGNDLLREAEKTCRDTYGDMKCCRSRGDLPSWAIEAVSDILYTRYRLDPAAKEAKGYLQKARTMLERQERRSLGSYTYDLARISALEGKPDECMRWLRKAANRGDRPHPRFVERDPDFDSVRNEQWFKDFLRELRAAK